MATFGTLEMLRVNSFYAKLSFNSYPSKFLCLFIFVPDFSVTISHQLTAVTYSTVSGL